MSLLVVTPRATAISPTATYDRRDLAFVTDDRSAVWDPGCDAISVIDVGSGKAIARGDFHMSPGQLAATSDGALVVSIATNSSASLYVLRRSQADPSSWVTSIIVDNRILRGAPDDNRILRGASPAISPDDTILLVPAIRGVEKYKLANLSSDSMGPVEGSYLDERMQPADIEISSDSRIGYVVGADGFVTTLELAGMSRMYEPIPYEPTARYKRYRVRRTFATLSPDERYLVINTGDQRSGALNVVDLQQRVSQLVPLPGVSESWGVKFNYVAANNGLLAVHGRSVVAVYEFNAFSPPTLLASARVPPQSIARWRAAVGFEDQARISSLAWSGRGDAVIAVLGLPSRQEWRVLDFVNGPTPLLVERLDFDSCTEPEIYNRISYGFDVLTLNDRLPRPPLTPTPTATGANTPTPTDTPTPTPSSTPTDTPTPPPTATATRIPQPIFLPLALREVCDPPQRRVDVALVIDASTSMQLRTSQNRMKITAAIEAARAFLDELSLPHDQAAIVTFNSDASVLQELTGNHLDLNTALNRIQDARQTRIDLGIEAAHEELASPRHKPANQPVMIVLTDGKANPVPVSAAVEKARLAKVDGITVFTIGLGDDLDFEALEAMASKRSYYYHAPDAEDLKDIYAQIAVAIPCPAAGFWGQRQ